MDTSLIVALLAVGVPLVGGFFAGTGWLFRQMQKNKDDQITRLSERLAKEEAQCEEYRRQISQLWSEKVSDARESSELVRAITRAMERGDA